MRAQTFSHELEVRAGMSKMYQYLLIVSFAINLLLGVGYIWLSDAVKVSIEIPPSAKKSFWVAGDKLSSAYLEEMGLYLIELRTNLTPESIAFKQTTLLRYATPNISGALREQFVQEAAQFKKDQISTMFAPAQVHIDELGQRIAFSGDFTRYVGKVIASQGNTTFMMRLVRHGGRTYFDQICQSSEGDPFNDKSTTPCS